MTDAPQTPPTSDPMHARAHLQDSGFGNMMGMSAAMMEAFSDLSAEVIGFMADRIKEDLKAQHEILHCKDVGELQHVQAQFIQKAIDQYQAETGKLVEMSSKVFQTKGDEA